MFKVFCEVTIKHISSPGTWLPNRDDLYLTIDSFNQVKRTRLSTPNFPLSLHEKFCFEKIFWSCTDAHAVVSAMEDLPVTVELRQVADIYLGGTMLSYFDTNARDFFYPCSNLCPRFVDNRELLMIRTVDFPGISPKVSFASYTVIEQLKDCAVKKGSIHGSKNRSDGDRSCCKGRSYPSAFNEPGYGQHTVNSALRSRSPSPMERAMAKGHVIADIVNHKVRDRQLKQVTNCDDREPFVVRKVQEEMFGRKPKMHKYLCYNNSNQTTSRPCKTCHPRCHLPSRIQSPTVGERLDKPRSRKTILRTVQSLSRPTSPCNFERRSFDGWEKDSDNMRSRRNIYA